MPLINSNYQLYLSTPFPFPIPFQMIPFHFPNRRHDNYFGQKKRASGSHADPILLGARGYASLSLYTFKLTCRDSPSCVNVSLPRVEAITIDFPDFDCTGVMGNRMMISLPTISNRFFSTGLFAIGTYSRSSVRFGDCRRPDCTSNIPHCYTMSSIAMHNI